MKFKINCEMEYQVLYPSTMIFNIHAHQTLSQVVLEESLSISQNLLPEEFSSRNSTSRFMRLQINEPLTFTIAYKAIVMTHYQLFDQKKLASTDITNLDGDIIPFLFPSRYCQSDKLQRLAYNEFGNIENAFTKVQAIADWIYQNIEYQSGSTNSLTSAFDTITERVGVCRDFAHLGIALCRALSIPARYFTGYAFKLYPPDFHACFEAYIGGQWIVFDPTRMSPLNGLVKIADGRDAAEAAVVSVFGNVLCNYINVECDALETGFVPIMPLPSQTQGLSYQ